MRNTYIFITFGLIVLIGLGILYYFQAGKDLPRVTDVADRVGSVFSGTPGEVGTFDNAEEFKDYLIAVESKYGGMADYFGGLGMARSVASEDFMVEDMAMAEPMALGESTAMNGSKTVDRVSETNVQTAGIDEPDIVKTDGQEIYYSNEDVYYYFDERPRGEVFIDPIEAVIDTDEVEFEIAPELAVDIVPPQEPYYGGTHMISALPVDSMAIDGTIDMTGQLLLADGTLIVIGYDELAGYDVTDPTTPIELWTIDIEDAYYQDARLYNGKIYLITSTWIDEWQPCPFEPLSINGEAVTVSCGDIYHPLSPVPSDTTYNVMIIDPTDGKVQNQVSFVGSDNSVLHMSPENLFITYSFPGSMSEIMVEFVTSYASDLFSVEVVHQISRLKDYDISEEAKMVEIPIIIDKYMRSLDSDGQLELENNLENKMAEFMDSKKRDLIRSGIVKIDLDDLSVDASGEVPGMPLNQFSLDEYEGNLRIGVTVGESFWWGFGSFGDSVNDLYVLDSNLKITGQVLDMGEGERIYSTRFIGDEGYMVTFRQIDPFYVFDLSDPKNPVKQGELKIPGYSSYLHPLVEDRILGVGKENSNVKLSLFDVSDPTNPTEASKFILDEYWSDVIETHHAFLHDTKHGIFFIPGNQGGYIFTYANDSLELKKAVSGVRAERAIFINDYLYVIGSNEIVVLDENTWERVGELDLN